MPRSAQERLIVVDDEVEVRDLVADYLRRYGFAVRACASGAELDRLLDDAPADLVILDVSMPEEDGLSIVRRLCATSDISIIMLTGRGDVVDRVVGLELGADDYVTKPFDLRELRARVRAVLRRRDDAPAAAEELAANANERVAFGDHVLDLAGYSLIGRDGAALPLTATEFDLLSAFARNPNRVLSRDRLLDIAGGRDREPFDRSIDIRVARVRKKIERDSANPQVIRTVRGAGYVFVPSQAA